MNISTRCNHCGSSIIFDDSREFMFCWHCGEQIFNPGTVAAPAQQMVPAPVPAPAPTQLVPVQPVPVNVMYTPGQDFYSGPNLFVSYQSDNNRFPMFFRIHTTNEKFNINPGQTMSFRLNQGRHALFFRIGNKYYRRDIRIIHGNAPIRAECSWYGRARIEIIQSSAIYR